MPIDLAARVAHYREQAAELRRLAAREPQGSALQAQLSDTAEQYEELATRVEAGIAPI